MTTPADAATSTDADLDAAIAHAREHAGRIEDQLVELLSIPSVSTQPEHAGDCRRAADWLAADLERAGLEHVAIMETGGHPVVYADWLNAPEGAPTVLVYGHYDVQPPDPLEEWRTPPFAPERPGDGFVYARGASDDKGQLLTHVKAVEAQLATSGALPVNVRFLLEGEEESGSPHLEDFVRANAGSLACDAVLISDTHMLAADQPSIVSSLRGMAYCEVTVRGPGRDLHSGGFGGAVRNPAEALVLLLAQLKDDEGRITIPGFYDDVVEPDAQERAQLAQVPFDEVSFLSDAGVSRGWGEAGWTTYERVGARPTLEINGMWSGYTGAGAKTVLPATASAKVSMRLVADQDWREVTRRFTEHVERLAGEIEGIESIEVVDLHGGPPSLIDTSGTEVRAASQALAQTFGTEPAFTREGGSIPVAGPFQQALGAPVVFMGYGLPDDGLHSPNERFSLTQLHRGIEAGIRFHHAWAALDAAER